MQLNYNRLTIQERVEISYLVKNGDFSCRKIAKEINWSPNTISRELKRAKDENYRYLDAHQDSIAKSKRNITKVAKHQKFLEFLYNNFDSKVRSIYIVIVLFKKTHWKTTINQDSL